LGTFPTPWAEGEILHCVLTYIPTGVVGTYEMTIPAGTAAITYRLETDPMWIYDPVLAEVPDPAVYVAPANGAIDLGYAGQILSWGPAVTGGVPTGYEVYFGTDNPPLTMVSDQVDTTWPTGALAQSTTYYWQAVAYNGDGPAVGSPVWSFTTRSELNPDIATNPIPMDLASFPAPVPGPFQQMLSWGPPAAGVVPTGYKIVWNGAPELDLGNVLSYEVTVDVGIWTWQVIPYYVDGGMRKVGKPVPATLGNNRLANVRGDAVGCPVWQFEVTPYVAPTYPVNVTSVPAGAAIWVDGINSGFMTPHIFNMVEGTSALYSVQMAGYTWAPVDYQVTNIMAPDAVNFIGTLLTYTVDVTSVPDGAAIYVGGMDSGFVTPHQFVMDYGTSAVYSVSLPQYTWVPVDYTVTNIMANDAVNFVGTFVPNSYTVDVTSAPAGAAIYVGGMDSGFVTPHTFLMTEGTSAVYSVMMAGYTWAPVDYPVTNIMANDAVNFVGTLLTYTVDVTSVPTGAAIYVDAIDSGFVTPHQFVLNYGDGAVYSVMMAGYAWMPVDYTVANIMANDAVNFVGSVIQYPVDITSTPAGAAIYVDAMDSGFVTPHTFMMDYNTSATYTVSLLGYVFTPASFVVTNIMAPAAQEFTGLGVDGMIEPGIEEYMEPPAGCGIPGVTFIDPASTPFNIDYFIYLIADMPILPVSPAADNSNTYGVVLSHAGGVVDMQVNVPAGIWYVAGYWGGMWHTAVLYPYAGTVPGYVTLYGIDFSDRADVPIYISQINPTLPVELQSFTAVLTAANFVNLTWVTASETGAAGYNIYRSDNDNVAEAYKVNPTMIAATNTSQTATYNMIDNENLQVNNTYYYWLESVEMTGTSAFNGPVNVTITGEVIPPMPDMSVMSNAYPNPFRVGRNTTINVDIKEGDAGTVTIYNLLGQVVKTYKVNEGQHTLTWNANGCASGIYFYKLSTPTVNSTKKLVIVN
jgi:hypothetical protein